VYTVWPSGEKAQDLHSTRAPAAAALFAFALLLLLLLRGVGATSSAACSSRCHLHSLQVPSLLALSSSPNFLSLVLLLLALLLLAVVLLLVGCHRTHATGLLCPVQVCVHSTVSSCWSYSHLQDRCDRSAIVIEASVFSTVTVLCTQ
jgi:hypothetical protein